MNQVIGSTAFELDILDSPLDLPAANNCQLLSPELADVLYRAQCCCLSIDDTGRPYSTAADMSYDAHTWFAGCPDHLSLLHLLEGLGFIKWDNSYSFHLTESGLRAQVTSPGFTPEQLASRQELFLSRVTAWFDKQNRGK